MQIFPSSIVELCDLFASRQLFFFKKLFAVCGVLAWLFISSFREITNLVFSGCWNEHSLVSSRKWKPLFSCFLAFFSHFSVLFITLTDGNYIPSWNFVRQYSLCFEVLEKLIICIFSICLRQLVKTNFVFFSSHRWQITFWEWFKNSLKINMQNKLHMDLVSVGFMRDHAQFTNTQHKMQTHYNLT